METSVTPSWPPAERGKTTPRSAKAQDLPVRCSSVDAPGREAADLSGMVEADQVAGRITQICFAPLPGLVPRRGCASDPLPCQVLDGGIDIRTLEIDDRVIAPRPAFNVMQGESCRLAAAIAFGTFETGIARRAVDDLLQAECLVERHARLIIDARHGYLVQSHPKTPWRARWRITNARDRNRPAPAACFASRTSARVHRPRRANDSVSMPGAMLAMLTLWRPVISRPGEARPGADAAGLDARTGKAPAMSPAASRRH